jgi:tetratricopeptide (TPR) repeat protein
MLKKLGNIEEAVKYYKSSIERNHHFPYSYLNLSIVYKEQSLYEKAVDTISEGISQQRGRSRH